MDTKEKSEIFLPDPFNYLLQARVKSLKWTSKKLACFSDFLLATFLLGVGLRFIPVLGMRKLKEECMSVKHYKRKVSFIDFYLLIARVKYVMCNPTSFLNVELYHDTTGLYRRDFPDGVNTKGKIYVMVTDNRGIFSDAPKLALVDQFKRKLEGIYSFIQFVATDMNTDIVAKFFDRKGSPLGYFYQGEYHLWEE